MRLIVIVTILGLAGCAGSASHLTRMSPAELQDSKLATNDKLVEALWYQRALNAKSVLDPEICDELVRRGSLTAAEVQRAKSKEFAVGDRIAVPYIGWGRFMKHNVFDAGLRHQYIISVGGSQFFFYTGPDRRITSYQVLGN